MVFRINRKQQQAIQINLKKKNALSSKERAWKILSVMDREDVTTLGSKTGSEALNLTIINSEFFDEPNIPENKIGTRFNTGLTKIQNVPTVEELKKEKLEKIEKNKKFIEESKKDVLEATNEKLQRFLSLPLDDFQRKLVNDEINRRKNL